MIKTAPATPLATLWLVALRQVAHNLGVPQAGCTVTGDAELVRPVTDPRIGIVFTGSLVGHAIAKVRPTQGGVELGPNAALIVDELPTFAPPPKQRYGAGITPRASLYAIQRPSSWNKLPRSSPVISVS